MEIDSAVEDEKVTRRQRPATRSASAGRSNAAPINDGGASTVVAEPPPVTERPQRPEPHPVSRTEPDAIGSDPAPQPIVSDPKPEAEPVPIVTETLLKPKVEESAPVESSLPAPVMPTADEEVEEAPPAFPETFSPPPPTIPPTEASPPSIATTPVPVPSEGGHDLSTFDLPEFPADEEPHMEEDAGPPASEKTQPIRTIERPGNLPPMHSESQTDSGDLPRLDASLAGDAGSISSQNKTINKADGLEKTKLRLPQPGEDSRRFTPADFIAPESSYDPEAPENRVEEVEEIPHSEPAPVEPEESYRIVDQEESYQEPVPGPVSFDRFDGEDQPEVPPFIPVEEKSLDDLEIEEESSEVSNWDPLAPPNPETAPEKLPDEDTVEGHLDEGSFENLFAQQSIEPTERQSEQRSNPSSYDPVTAQSHDELAPDPVGVEQKGPMTGLNRDSQVLVKSGSRSDNDVLDEMFGSSRSTPFRLKKSTLIMLGVCALLATIAVVIVMVAGSALGFWGDSPTTMDPVTQAPESMKPKEEAPEVAEESTGAGADSASGDAPASIDPVAVENPGGGSNEEETVSSTHSGSTQSGSTHLDSTLSLPGDTETPVRIVDSSAPASAPPAPSGVEQSSESEIGNPRTADEPEALSFDERVQNIVNGNGLDADAAPSMPDSSSAVPPTNDPGSFAAESSNPASAAAPAQVENYNPPETFAAPGPDDGPLGKTHDLIDAFLRAPDWRTRAKYVYQADSLMPAMEEYYKKWPDRRLDRYSHQLYAMESDVEFGGPYWVYLISQSDDDEGYPFIIRVEDGNLKVDWESHSEFFDQRWVKFQQGGIAVPNTFRVAIERVSDYYGPDRDEFENLDEYFVYKINPPYGGDDEFMEYAFVKKGTELAAQLDNDAGLGEEALAVMLTLDYEQFPHGAKYLVVRDYVSEGWFR